ncbi:MAG TPA: alpha-N-acetylglucosaminidase [Cyclobacteriaceae bacterium]|nr:alpha-N-acetylglucosaminidase [Cyclobacteriaceae bacterium]
MIFKKFIFLFAFLVSLLTDSRAQSDQAAALALISRVLPKYSNSFRVESLAPSTMDVFEVESKQDRIILRGSSNAAVASALYYYIKEYGKGQITWNGTNLNLPDPLPKVQGKIRKTSPYQYRYYLNYCTFNYSMSWWDWERWEKEIDWMALHGINMPLAITGQEYIWYEVYKSLGFSDEDLNVFFCGPAYFAWFWMGNLDAWGGPLPKSWMERQKQLQQKIVTRQRELGMKPVLPAFTGHVPPSFIKYFPNAKLKKTNWGNGFADTYILDSQDPLFAEIGRKFLETQTKFYGTDHLYSADTFNENEPPSDEPEFLSTLSRRVYEGMRTADPEATWVMQGWLFYSDRKFWHAPQIRALLGAVPDEHMIILDLTTEIEPVWKRTEAFYGKPWIWNMLHNFGGNISLFGRMDGVAEGPPTALKDSTSGKLKGIGLTMEGIEQNPVLYELMTDHTWRDEPIDVNTWLPKYIHNRYGSINEHALNAWKILRKTVYNGEAIRDGAESIFVARPTLDSEQRWAKTKLNYAAADLLPAWDELLLASATAGNYDGYQYDLVDVTRQVLADYAIILHSTIVQAYHKKDIDSYHHHTSQFLALLDDIDHLLATRKDFLLGPWIDQARSCGDIPEEKALYERNARNLITLWGDKNNGLHEYSCRQWSGLISDFYKPRWEKFFSLLNVALKDGDDADIQSFESSIKDWEWQWVNTQKNFTIEPTLNALNVVNQLHKKYRSILNEAYGI